MTLDALAKAVVALFPPQETESGQLVATHRVETKTDEKRPGVLLAVIIQVFPTPARRFEVELERDGEEWLCSPSEPTSAAMAQLVATVLQDNAIGPLQKLTTEKRESGVYATRFRLTPEPEVAVSAPGPSDPTIPASPAPKRQKPAPEASV